MPSIKKSSLKFNTYGLMSDAVDCGVRYGIRRYYKHRDDEPEEEEIQRMADTIAIAVMNDLSELIMWED